jgi:hypothetical protein
MFSFSDESVPNLIVKMCGIKFAIDTFYVCATIACGLLYCLIPDKAHDIALAGLLVASVAVVDALASVEEV